MGLVVNVSTTTATGALIKSHAWRKQYIRRSRYNSAAVRINNWLIQIVARCSQVAAGTVSFSIRKTVTSCVVTGHVTRTKDSWAQSPGWWQMKRRKSGKWECRQGHLKSQCTESGFIRFDRCRLRESVGCLSKLLRPCWGHVRVRFRLEEERLGREGSPHLAYTQSGTSLSLGLTALTGSPRTVCNYQYHLIRVVTVSVCTILRHFVYLERNKADRRHQISHKAQQPLSFPQQKYKNTRTKSWMAKLQCQVPVHTDKGDVIW